MATRIIILEKLESNRYRAAMWADVPVARQPFYADAGLVSQFKNIAAGDLSKLRAGQLTERVIDFYAAPADSLGQIEAKLQTQFAAFQNEINSANPWTRYGSMWDDATGWSLQNVS